MNTYMYMYIMCFSYKYMYMYMYKVLSYWLRLKATIYNKGSPFKISSKTLRAIQPIATKAFHSVPLLYVDIHTVHRDFEILGAKSTHTFGKII